jgi:Arm domain-containing DNA-binding protein/integrase-like protein
MALNDTAIRNLKPQQTPYKKSDGDGLYLSVMPEGSMLWRLAYRFAGKQKTIALGSYPAVTLAMAREAKLEARRLLAQAIDPSEKRKADKRAAAAARTFGEVADEWFDTKRVPEGKSEATLKRDRWLRAEWKSAIGDRPIGEIEPPELLPALKKVAARKHYETASRMRALASQVFRFGIANGYCQRDMAADLKDALTSPKSKPRPGLTDAVAVGKLCRAIDGYAGKGSLVRLALRLLSLTLLRPGEVAKAEMAPGYYRIAACPCRCRWYSGNLQQGAILARPRAADAALGRSAGSSAGRRPGGYAFSTSRGITEDHLGLSRNANAGVTPASRR